MESLLLFLSSRFSSLPLELDLLWLGNRNLHSVVDCDIDKVNAAVSPNSSSTMADCTLNESPLSRFYFRALHAVGLSDLRRFALTSNYSKQS